MKGDRNLLYGGAAYGLFVTAAVYWLGVYLEVSGSVLVRVIFSLACGGLASLVFFFSYLAGKRRGKGD